MTIGIKDLVDQINSEILSPVLDSTRTAQLAGSSTFNTYSVATKADLPAAVDNKGRFILVLDSDSYYFSDGVKWTNKVESTVGSIITPWVWGYNSNGPLGDGTTVNKSSPILTASNGSMGWKDISLYSHTVAIRDDNTIWSWGCNTRGQLGDGTIVNKCSPVSVIGGFNDWCNISASTCSTVAIRTIGTAWSWGNNGCGALGDGTTANKSSPVPVVGGFTDWCGLSTGKNFGSGIRKLGSLWSWGYNNVGQLGDGTTVNKSSPVSVVGGFADWRQISAAFAHSLAIRNNGTAWSWGTNTSGQLGDGTTVNKSSPVSVVGGFTDWCQANAGITNSIAVRANGTAWAWGGNGFGELGDGTVIAQSSPISVIGGFTDWCNVGTGNNGWSVGIRTNGTAWAWGNNGCGQLGDGTTISKLSPVSVIGGFTDWHEVRLGKSNTAILRYTPKGL